MTPLDKRIVQTCREAAERIQSLEAELDRMRTHAYRCGWTARGCVEDDRADAEEERALRDYLSGQALSTGER